MTNTLKDRLFIVAQYLLPHHLISRLIGVLAQSEQPWIKAPLIRLFLRRFDINLAEAEREEPNDYRSFNDFFTRALKADSRPSEGDAADWISPVDACISQFGRISAGRIIQAKGRDYSLSELLGGDTALAEHFEQGEFATLYLAPKDYHRIHMPMAARLVKTRFIPGKLFSVNPLTANTVPRLFARNERLVCEFDSPNGRFVMVLVGAMVVASIETTWSGVVAPWRRRIHEQAFDTPAPVFERGQEMGRFRLGSTVILAFEPDRMRWSAEIKKGANVKLGQRLNQCS
ncbi:archaetidylserine decarboxylase [Reinekea sp.]|jgi:phosphatidylserine decarboxylase|uniref:archaetidylserine decarboxylase n=1 Tax=Reinekea sp. TaxID=1970455 RepID=UPI002A8207C0|nr:archaetidylserine decarboxylase [Reinekea sp.]